MSTKQSRGGQYVVNQIRTRDVPKQQVSPLSLIGYSQPIDLEAVRENGLEQILENEISFAQNGFYCFYHSMSAAAFKVAVFITAFAHVFDPYLQHENDIDFNLLLRLPIPELNQGMQHSVDTYLDGGDDHMTVARSVFISTVMSALNTSIGEMYLKTTEGKIFNFGPETSVYRNMTRNYGGTHFLRSNKHVEHMIVGMLQQHPEQTQAIKSKYQQLAAAVANIELPETTMLQIAIRHDLVGDYTAVSSENARVLFNTNDVINEAVDLNKKIRLQARIAYDYNVMKDRSKSQVQIYTPNTDFDYGSLKVLITEIGNNIKTLGIECDWPCVSSVPRIITRTMLQKLPNPYNRWVNKNKYSIENQTNARKKKRKVQRTAQGPHTNMTAQFDFNSLYGLTEYEKYEAEKALKAQEGP